MTVLFFGGGAQAEGGGGGDEPSSSRITTTRKATASSSPSSRPPPRRRRVLLRVDRATRLLVPFLLASALAALLEERRQRGGYRRRCCYGAASAERVGPIVVALAQQDENGVASGQRQPRRRRRPPLRLDLHPTGAEEELRRRYNRQRRRRLRRLRESRRLDEATSGGVSGSGSSSSSSNSSILFVGLDEIGAFENGHDDDDSYRRWLSEEWNNYDGNSNAVYAGIPDPDDPYHFRNRRLREFYEARHLSRYERLHREERGVELNLGWDGTYAFDDDDNDQNRRGFYDDVLLPSELIQRQQRQQQQQGNETSDTTRRDYRENLRFLNQEQRRHAMSTSAAATATTVSAVSANTITEFTGGQFDNYQSVPLSQGYGTHFANVWVGSPTPQRKTVIVDTGSHFTAFPCSGCSHCGGPHHTDPYFEPDKSESFHALQCDECRDGVVCEKGECRFTQSYTEGSSWVAVQVKDRFYCGGTDILDSVEPNDEKYAIDFMFGCQVSMAGLFITQLADGIMGMSAHAATLPKQLYDKRISEHNLFALCYRRELGTSKRGVTAGSMTIGGFSTALDTTPVVYARNMANSGWYTVYVKGIFIRSGGGLSAKSQDEKHKTIRVRVDHASLNSGKGVIVDSGTTDTYLNKAVAKDFNKAWQKATGQKYSHAPIQLTPEQLRGLPTILVQCHASSQKVDPSIDDYGSVPGYAGRLDPKNPNDLLIAIPATSYMDYSPITKQYTSRVYFTESSGGVLGSNAMQGHNVVFDWENGRIGFAESSCTYDRKNTPMPGLDEGFSVDCLVGNPVLSQACIDTVDQRLCEHHPNNIALLGTEVWSAIVESAGTDAGSSCVESAKDWVTANEMDDPVIKCVGGGLCEERRPCQLTCSEAGKAAQVTRIFSTKKQNDCGDSFWSACDYGCTQSRILSAPFTDGFCHEISRQSRPCHIGACARSDPCRVPFLVHAVIGFRGGSLANWSLATEDVFVSALTKTAATLSHKRLFGNGDVNVLAVLPWYQDDGGDEGWDDLDSTVGSASETNELGLKVVLEISIFNPQAKVGNETLESLAPDNEGNGNLLYSAFQNITDRFSLKEAKTTCRADDLYALAKQALVLKREVIRHEEFVPLLIDEVKKTGNGITDQPNAPFLTVETNTIGRFAEGSRVIAVWSIRTEIDDEINYFGPPKPWWFKVIAAAHAVAFVIMAFMLLSTAWTIMLGFIDAFRDKSKEGNGMSLSARWGRYLFGRNYRQQRYTTVSITDDVEDVIMGASSRNIELTTIVQPSSFNNRYRGTTKKRRSKIYTIESRSSSDL